MFEFMTDGYDNYEQGLYKLGFYFLESEPWRLLPLTDISDSFESDHWVVLLDLKRGYIWVQHLTTYWFWLFFPRFEKKEEKDILNILRA